MKTLKMTFAAVAAVLLAGAFGGTASALANAALDQYFEQVPTPKGPESGQKPPTKPLDPKIEKKLNDSGDEGSQLGQVAAATAPDVAPVEETAGVPITAGDERQLSTGKTTRSKRAGKKRDSHGIAKRNPQAKKDSEAQLNGLLGEESPGTAESLSAAASASGINSPLAVFVILAAIVMSAIALRRRIRGDQA